MHTIYCGGGYGETGVCVWIGAAEVGTGVIALPLLSTKAINDRSKVN